MDEIDKQDDNQFNVNERQTLPIASKTYLEPHRLEHFLAAYETKNFHHAAALNSVSQQAVSKAVAKLEETLEVKLFERLPTGVKPTIYADHLARRAKLILAESRQASLEIFALRGYNKVEIRVGVGPSFTPRLFPRAVNRLRKRATDVGVKSYGGLSQKLIPMLLAGEIEFAVVAPPYGTFIDADLEVEKIYEEVDIVMGRVNHPLANLPERTLKDYTDYPWVVPMGLSKLWSGVVDMFATEGVDPPKDLLRLDTIRLAIGHVIEGDALSLMPHELVVHEIASGIVQTIDHPILRVRRPVLMIKRKQAQLTPSANLMYSILKSVLQQYGSKNLDI